MRPPGGFTVVFRVLRSRSQFVAPARVARLAAATAILAGVFLARINSVLAAGGSPVPTAQTTQSGPPEGDPTTAQDEAQFRLRVESNLVIVRVVVRDSQGRPVENLRKEDFRLLDDGKEQTISQFSVEMPPSGVTNLVSPGASEVKQTPASAAPAPRILALYFDDLNMELGDINYSRDSAYSYLVKNLQPSHRVAVFSSSGSAQTGFTSDLKTLHDALSKLWPIMPVSGKQDCPTLSDYQAQQIFDHEDSDAINLALAEAAMRNCQLPPGEAGKTVVKATARRVVSQYRQRAQRSLDGLNGLVNGMANFPGQKEIIFTSAGFLSQEIQDQIDGIINRALRAQIVISSLDPKGVALLMPEADVSIGYIPTQGNLTALMHSYATTREFQATSVLSQMAEGTGGDLFHNNNDLKAGFTRLAGQPVFYTLAFSPSNLDGKFHKLQVRLTQSRGTVQARRGYFAIKAEQNEQTEQAKQAEQNKEELRQVVASREEFRQLSIDVNTEIAPSSGETKQLAVLVRLDLSSVTFRKEGSRNLNTLTFVAGIYDSDGKWVTGEQKQFNLKLPDSQLQDMRAKGVGVRNTFQLKPGKYLLREVVEDSEDHHMAALNRELQVP